MSNEALYLFGLKVTATAGRRRSNLFAVSDKVAPTPDKGAATVTTLAFKPYGFFL